MQDLESRKMGNKHIGFLVALDVITVIVLLAVGYFWADNRFRNLEDRMDSISLQQRPNTGQTPANPSVTSPTAPVTEYKSKKGATLTVDAPLSNATVSSPLKITGQAPENWFFEGQFTVELKDASGHTIVSGPAKIVKGDNSDTSTPFSASLAWHDAASSNGTLVLSSANPSGMADKSDSVEIPVKF